jgi:hypothetical protein
LSRQSARGEMREWDIKQGHNHEYNFSSVGTNNSFVSRFFWTSLTRKRKKMLTEIRPIWRETFMYSLKEIRLAGSSTRINGILILPYKVTTNHSLLHSKGYQLSRFLASCDVRLAILTTKRVAFSDVSIVMHFLACH